MQSQQACPHSGKIGIVGTGILDEQVERICGTRNERRVFLRQNVIADAEAFQHCRMCSQGREIGLARNTEHL